MPENSYAVVGVHPWFAVRVKPRHEKTAAAALRHKGFEEFLPLHAVRRRWSDRMAQVELPLFPGYVFSRFDPNTRVPVLTTPGVTGIVAFGNIPAPIDNAEIQALQSVARAGLTTEPWPYLKAGERAVVVGGPLRGVEGILIENRGGCRVVLSVTLLHRSIAIEVDREWLEPVTASRAA